MPLHVLGSFCNAQIRRESGDGASQIPVLFCVRRGLEGGEDLTRAWASGTANGTLVRVAPREEVRRKEGGNSEGGA